MAGFSVLSAERCLALLDLLSREPDGLHLSRLASSLALPASAVHRLLATLVTAGYVRQDTVTDRYMPTLAIAAMGLRLLSTLGIPNVCQPSLDRLAEQTGELVRLSAVEGARLIWIAKAQGSRSALRYDPITGRDVPLHATSMGKIWLSTLPEDEAVRIVGDRGYGGDLIGPNAIRDEASLRTELRVTRARNFGLVQEEAEAGVSAIAMVVQTGAQLVAVVSIAGPSFRLTEERLTSFATMLRETANELSQLWPVRTFQQAQVA